MSRTRVCVIVTLVAAACAMPYGGSPSDSPSTPTDATTSDVTSATTFATPQEAMEALLVSADDPAHAEALLGPGGADVLCNCDADDSDDLAEVRAKMQEQIKFTDDGPDAKHVLLGSEEWELPLPLVRTGDRWQFDVAAGKEELLSRFIGYNELHAIATLRELVDAQDEFDAATRDGDKPTFAQKWASTPGHQDGLHWENGDQKPESPLGPRLCPAPAEGSDSSESAPTNGYRFRIIKGQGAHACGGAELRRRRRTPDRRVRLHRVAVQYGTTGVMTSGQPSRHRLPEGSGREDPESAEQFAAFDPDASWEPVRD
jgi:hypothetical protein